MLVEAYEAMVSDEILSLIAAVNNRPVAKRIQKGVYELGHFGGSHYMRGWKHYPILSVGCYGVCDSVEQLLEQCPELDAGERKFVITVHTVRKDEEESPGGWRWHKWGEYIGNQSPQREYIADEPEIDQVLVYHIYEKH